MYIKLTSDGTVLEKQRTMSRERKSECRTCVSVYIKTDCVSIDAHSHEKFVCLFLSTKTKKKATLVFLCKTDVWNGFNVYKNDVEGAEKEA